MAGGSKTRKPDLEREARFVREFMIDRNATQAAIRAGYKPSSAKETGYRLRKLPRVRDAIAREEADLSRRTGVTAERVIFELATIAFSKLTDILIWENGKARFKCDSNELSDADQRAILQVVESEKFIRSLGEGESLMSREHSVKVHDKLKALELLSRYFGVRTVDPDGTPTSGGAAGDQPPVKAYTQEDWDKIPS